MKTKMFKTALGMSSVPTEEGVYLISTSPVGEPRIREGQDCSFEEQNAEHLFSDGTTRISERYYSRIIVPKGKEGHDFCGYCGADNGVNGILRVGFDCYNCNSN